MHLHLYTLAQIKNGTGFQKGTQFVAIVPEPTQGLRKLMEGVAEIGRQMGAVRYMPDDMWSMHGQAIAWATEYEALYDAKVAAGEWNEDAWMDNIDGFVRDKLEPLRTDDNHDAALFAEYYHVAP